MKGTFKITADYLKEIGEHCRRHKPDEASFITRFIAQCKTWGITEANTTFCVRGSVPRYKTPY